MKKYISVATIVALGFLTIALIIPRMARSDAPTPMATPKQTALEQRQAVWIAALQWCESRGVDTAINKVDRDGTPSYGAFQFKPSTYASLAKRYSLASTTDFMNADEQRLIVQHMINDPTISNEELRTRQFPDCIQRKIGLPPR